MKPIYLLADSALLFWKDGNRRFLERILGDIEKERPKAAYVGASNGDDPDFFALFEAAMEGIGIRDNSMVRSEPSESERLFLDAADLILLSGGDPLRGWRTIDSNGIRGAIARRYDEGAVLCGVSAGAVQLGWGIETGAIDGSTGVVPTFRFVPCVVDVHGEASHWKGLKRALVGFEAETKGVGIPQGAGMVFRSEDNSIEPIRRPLHELVISNEIIDERLLFPTEGGSSRTRVRPLQEHEGGRANGTDG